MTLRQPSSAPNYRLENWPKVIDNIALGQAILGRVTASSYILRLEGQDLRFIHSAKP